MKNALLFFADVHYLSGHTQPLMQQLPPLQPEKLIGDQMIPSEAT
jgi:hypothetical protein